MNESYPSAKRNTLITLHDSRTFTVLYLQGNGLFNKFSHQPPSRGWQTIRHHTCIANNNCYEILRKSLTGNNT